MPEPKHLTNLERLPIAQQHYEQWFESGCEFLIDYGHCFERANYKKAAFELHQSVERFYACILLVLSNYRPRTHNIKNLRNMAIDKASPESPLNNIFLGNDKFQRRCFERLKRAYIDSRYSEHYKINQEELEWLVYETEKLKKTTQLICETHITNLKPN